jgi:hypothetical protein
MLKTKGRFLWTIRSLPIRGLSATCAGTLIRVCSRSVQSTRPPGLRIIGVDANTGAVKPIVDEESKTFICYSSKFFADYLDDSGEIIWMSERAGWNHLISMMPKPAR